MLRLRTVLPWLFVFTYSSALLAQAAPVHVLVFDGDGGLAAGVEVTLDCDTTQNATTTAEGDVWFNAGRGTCVLTIDDSKKQGTTSFDLAGDEVEVLVTLRDPIEFVVDGATIEKKVEEVAVEPGVVIVSVTALENQKTIGNAQIFVRGRDEDATTDASGNARLTLPPGTYDLSSTRTIRRRRCKG